MRLKQSLYQITAPEGGIWPWRENPLLALASTGFKQKKEERFPVAPSGEEMLRFARTFWRYRDELSTDLTATRKIRRSFELAGS